MDFLCDLLRKANTEREEGDAEADEARLVRVDFLMDLFLENEYRGRGGGG